ncbi:MAG: ABC transporter permease [Ruminococcus sp.]|nr:ABC transporter permease [Ruminococcus sp.]MDD6446898.1 ABC transporter permease [Ruminococcus sp.]
MTPTLWKNIFREIWQSKGRFLSILAIVALGVGFFAGVKGASPTMLKTAEKYYLDSNLMDIRLVSTVGFDKNDIKAMEEVNGVTKVAAGYMLDVMVDTDKSAEVYRLHSIDNSMNKLNVTDGRLPEKSGEIAVEKNFTYSVGDTIKIQQYAGDTNVDDMLKSREYTVVGVVESPLYMSYDHGTTTIGTGEVSYSAYLNPEEFKSDRYTQVFVSTEYTSSEVSPFTDEYKKGVDRIADKLENVANDRLDVFRQEVVEPAKDKLRDGEVEYASEAAAVEKKLNDAQNKIDSGKTELATQTAQAQKKLDDTEEKLTKGESQLPYSITTYYEEILAAQNEINSKELLLQEAKGQLATAKNTYSTSISQAETQLKTAQTQYDAQYEEFYQVTKPQAEEKINTYTPLLEDVQTNLNNLTELLNLCQDSEAKEKYKKQINDLSTLVQSYKTQLQNGQQQLADGEEQLEQAKAQLDTAKAQLEQSKTDGQSEIDSAQAQIDSAQQQLATAKSQFDAAKKEGKHKLDKAQSSITTGKQQVKQGRKQLADTKDSTDKKLSDAQKELDKNKETAQKKLEEAQKKLNDAQAQLDKISSPRWYVTTRQDLDGYGSYYDDTQSVDAIAMVFPLFFLAVAVLVCLTTMSRLLEERRTEIGTLKALGYSSVSILSKYFIYSSTAAIIGSVVGCVAGVFTLPAVIFNTYKLLYKLPDMELAIPWSSMVIGSIASIICTCGVVLFVGYGLMRVEPSKLMRPKAPRPGKRILLERIGFVWNHIGFTSKVTARNIFRYKSRFLMTVLGVAGCTALIVAAFGLKDSINAVITQQFGDVIKYSGVIVPKDNITDEQQQELYSFVENYNDVEAAQRFNYHTGKVTDKADKQYQISVYTIEDVSQIDKLIDLHTRISGEKLKLSNNGIILTEKIANILNLSVGDTITYTYENKDYTVKINGICENHINNYIYMTPEYYKEIYKEDPSYNVIIEKHSMDVEKEDDFGTKLLKRDDVTGVSFLSGNIDKVSDMLNNLNVIVYVMIICAAALAFVVLYNLTNINIAERVREIATIKVLGFYNRETSAYVYRENIVLTIVGILVGLVLGVFLTNFIISTAEVDTVMFGRTVSWLSFVYASAFTALFALIVNFVMYFKINAISMVESLKSIE